MLKPQFGGRPRGGTPESAKGVAIEKKLSPSRPAKTQGVPPEVLALAEHGKYRQIAIDIF
jgi:hypothetical protein